MNYSLIAKKVREELFLTQEELAEMLGVSLVTVNRWENEVCVPTIKAKKKLIEICKKNNIEIGEARCQ